ncbi:50S ribosomal protein L9 [Corynebacterium kutscheri]|uniref:Large ribosomal subunit protein bL9 n=1 Tax=Corynebacterium kutscheri TaxID=35755 RepID=A0A0F6TEM2_9CORY|nr:50S ribosomal protein L9 [Corynebacterium kutscheri]AKE42189.1 ribosomal protein L9 [Corynebacterium kutscheri]VEH05799.1 50S ribosomal protein L9 [Corynebacterium kutscheri]VEH10532.1 50S ribosomal protein L9 [Corynebacterium kutscheri]VEH81691.1 50S ribosomal protein L9 [Corynebacterium kutscheri]
MKLILTAAVENLGVAGDIVEVKDGYGRNLLLPRGLAIVATRGAEKQIEGIKRAQEARAIRDLDHAREVKAQLEALEGVSVAVRTSEKGKIFGSVSAEDIAAAVKAAGGPSLDKRSIELKKNLVKSVGSYSVDVKLHSDIAAAKVNFEVVAA